MTISRHAETAHASIFQPRGQVNPSWAMREPASLGSEEWFLDRVGTDREVLLIGPHSARFACRLADRGCRVEVVGSEPSEVGGLLPFCSRATAEDLGSADLGREIGGGRFDVVVVAELLDVGKQPGRLLLAIRDLLVPGGFVVASQTIDLWRDVPDSTPAGLDAARPSRGSILGVFEDAGFAVNQFRPMTLPGRVPGPEAIGQGSADPKSIDDVVWVERSLLVAHPIRNLGTGSNEPGIRALIGQKDEACRKSSVLARELRAATVRVDAIASLLALSVEREDELQYQLLQAHEQVARGDDELEAMARRLIHAERRIHELESDSERLEGIIRDVAAHRDDLEARLLGFRRSLPGKLFRMSRALLSMGRR